MWFSFMCLILFACVVLFLCVCVCFFLGGGGGGVVCGWVRAKTLAFRGVEGLGV